VPWLPTQLLEHQYDITAVGTSYKKGKLTTPSNICHATEHLELLIGQIMESKGLADNASSLDTEPFPLARDANTSECESLGWVLWPSG
jgi:hypothetical protein